MYSITVPAEKPYSIQIGTFLLEKTGHILATHCKENMALILCDKEAQTLFGSIILKALEDSGIHSQLVALNEWDSDITTEVLLGTILEALPKDRANPILIGLGDKPLCDALRTYASHNPESAPPLTYALIPTTLAAMVASSVSKGCAPRAVLADIGCLATQTKERFEEDARLIVSFASTHDEELGRALAQTPLTLETLMHNVPYVASVVARVVSRQASSWSLEPKANESLTRASLAQSRIYNE